MKKITLALFGFFMTLSTSIFSQTYSTGMVLLSDAEDLEYSARVDVTSTLVTLTMVGPADRWLGLSFRSTTQPFYMTAGDDVVIFDGTTLTDRYYGTDFHSPGDIAWGYVPSLDAIQDWTVVTNEVSGNVRTLVATRLPNTGNPNDYVFSSEASALILIWAKGQFDSFELDYHGYSNKGATAQALTLSNQDIALNDFKISPNPSKSKITISLPNGAANVKLDVFDVLGKKIMTKSLSSISSTFDVSKWNTGVYLMRVSSDSGTQTKRFVKQ